MTKAAVNVPLASVTTWLSGGTPDRTNESHWYGSIPWISAATLKHSRICGSDQYLTEAGVRAGSKLAPEGATLVLVRGMALHREIRIGMATRPVSFNQDVKAVIPGPSLIPEFLLYFLQAHSSQLRALVSSAGSGTGVLSTQRLQRVSIWLPDKPTQRRIVAAIEAADRYTEVLERLIAKKQAINRGIMQELLTGRTRFPGFTEGWPDVYLGDVIAVRHGKNQKAVENPAGNVPILATGGQIGWAGSPLYSKPSVLIGRKGTIDRPQYQATPFWTVDTLFYTEIAASVDPRFLYYVFLTVDWRSMNEASGVPSLSARRVENVEIQLPDIEEQRRIRRVLDDADREVELLHERLAKAKAIKRGMMQELLTGRTRLPVEDMAA